MRLHQVLLVVALMAETVFTLPTPSNPLDDRVDELLPRMEDENGKSIQSQDAANACLELGLLNVHKVSVTHSWLPPSFNPHEQLCNGKV